MAMRADAAVMHRLNAISDNRSDQAIESVARFTTIRRFSCVVLSTLAVLVTSVSPATADTASSCTGAGRLPAELSAPAMRTTMLCVVNSERLASGAGPLRRGRTLARVARRHAKDMVTRHYFAHVSPEGMTLQDRVAKSGWMSSRAEWCLGENLAWGAGSLATPQAVVAAWMGSPGHRRTLVDPRFQVIGIGVADGIPLDSGDEGATYAVDFGARRARVARTGSKPS